MNSSKYLFAVADLSQFDDLFQGQFLKGFRNSRLALVGRSNVGKSSLINALMGGKLAHTSNRPGKTKAIHFYYWGETNKILVDLPGYGYAQVAKSERANWEKLIGAYLDQDVQLERAIVLLDARHGPTEVDCEAIQFLSLKKIPVTFVMTKVDTLKTQSLRVMRKREVQESLKALGLDVAELNWVSSREKTGIKELIRILKSSHSEE